MCINQKDCMIKEEDDHDDKSYNRIEVFSVFFS